MKPHDDLGTQLRAAANTIQAPDASDLAARIAKRVDEPNRQPLRFPGVATVPVWPALTAAALIAIAIAGATWRPEGQAVGPVESITGAQPDSAPSFEVQSVPSFSLSEINPVSALNQNPLEGEIAALEADLRSAGDFFLAVLPGPAISNTTD